MFKEKNTASNLPAQIDLFAESSPDHADEYSFLFIAKGEESSQQVLTPLPANPRCPQRIRRWPIFSRPSSRKSAPPPARPYHLAVARRRSALSASKSNLKTVKLASTGYLDGLPTSGSTGGRAFRDLDWEKRVYDMCTHCGIGAQFGGKYIPPTTSASSAFSRHAASCPIGIGVSCSADRNAIGKITKDGVFLEQLEFHPEKYLPAGGGQPEFAPPVAINL